MSSPFQRPGETPQKTGRRFEAFWAKLLGTEPQRASGGLWYAPLDVGDTRLLWSLKFSAKDVLRFGKYHMKDLFHEVQEAITGQGGSGGEIIPAVATAEEDGEVYVTLRADDLLRIIQSDQAQYVVPSKGAQKRARAKIPALLREDDTD